MITKVISKSCIISEGIKNLLEQKFENSKVEQFSSLKDLIGNDIDDIKMLIVQVQYDYHKDFELIQQIKQINKNIKILIVDIYKNKDVLKQVIRLNLEGYVSEELEMEDFLYIIKSLLKGRKYYEGDMLGDVVQNSKNKLLEMLTEREQEVFGLIKSGLDNKEISSNLYITENTVKKHVSSIIHKLHIKNRKQIILYN